MLTSLSDVVEGVILLMFWFSLRGFCVFFSVNLKLKEKFPPLINA